MSHLRVKREYNEEGTYGSVDKFTLYCHHNLSCDYTTFYDHNGNVIFSFPDTMDNNIFDAMIDLARPYKGDVRNNTLGNGISHMDLDDMKKCGI